MKSAGIDAFEPLTPTLALATIVGLEQQGVTLKAAFLPEEEGDLIDSDQPHCSRLKACTLATSTSGPDEYVGV
jgi:hypothetical protein